MPSHGEHKEVRRRILLVEDDASINDVVRSTLQDEGYVCHSAYSGTEAKLLIDSGEPFDLAICDLMLPGISGEDVVALIRLKSSMPILVISAKAQVVDRVTLLRMGADDYLVKPFDLDELVARVEVLLRRVAPIGRGEQYGVQCGLEDFRANGGAKGTNGSKVGEVAASLSFGVWRLNESARRFEVAGTPIKLTRTEFDIIAALMRHPRKVFTKRDLYRAVWNEEAAVEEKAINTHISNIRAKLKGSGTEDYIETVWGIGFKLMELRA